MYQHPRGTPIHKRARMRAGDFENDPYISLIRVGVALTDLPLKSDNLNTKN